MARVVRAEAPGAPVVPAVVSVARAGGRVVQVVVLAVPAVPAAVLAVVLAGLVVPVADPWVVVALAVEPEAAATRQVPLASRGPALRAGESQSGPSAKSSTIWKRQAWPAFGFRAVMAR